MLDECNALLSMASLAFAAHKSNTKVTHFITTRPLNRHRPGSFKSRKWLTCPQSQREVFSYRLLDSEPSSRQGLHAQSGGLPDNLRARKQAHHRQECDRRRAANIERAEPGFVGIAASQPAMDRHQR